MDLNEKQPWHVVFVPDAQEDFADFDKGLQKIIFEQLTKIKKDPLKIGAPLRGPLSDLRKLYFFHKTYRIVFEIQEKKKEVVVWGIGRRDKSEVYETVKKRLSR